ncbi:unnamed protein product [Malus baccata var. baccata]
MEAIRRLRDQAVFKQFSGGVYGGSDNVASDENEFQLVLPRLLRLFFVCALNEHHHYQKEIVHGVEGYIVAGSNALSFLVPSYQKIAGKYGSEKTCTSEPLRAMIVGAPLEDARHLAQRYARMRQEAEAQRSSSKAHELYLRHSSTYRVYDRGLCYYIIQCID